MEDSKFSKLRFSFAPSTFVSESEDSDAKLAAGGGICGGGTVGPPKLCMVGGAGGSAELRHPRGREDRRVAGLVSWLPGKIGGGTKIGSGIMTGGADDRSRRAAGCWV